MKVSRKHLIFTFAIFLIAIFLVTYELPYYIYKPGHTAELSDMVMVDDRYESEGKMQLVTISGSQATPLDYIISKFIQFHELIPIGDARPEGMSDEEYMHGQLHLMENSQHASTIVAYEAAGKEIKINDTGIHVLSTVEDMPAATILRAGDIITAVDDKKLIDADELISYVETKNSGDEIELQITRDGKTFESSLILSSFPDDPTRIGIGVQLITERTVDVDPPLEFDSGKIGGPSAGLMFALEIYNQLTEEDISKGYNIVGTGEIDAKGNVLRIGGIDKKVVAAHKKKCDIFFVPHENGRKDSNYEVAKKTAEAIGTEMEIVPIDHFSETLNYLEQLEHK